MRGVVIETAQALGRFPWLAPFFFRARRLRPVLPMVILLEANHDILSNTVAVRRIGPALGGYSVGRVSRSAETSRHNMVTRIRSSAGAVSAQERATNSLTRRCSS